MSVHNNTYWLVQYQIEEFKKKHRVQIICEKCNQYTTH